MGTLASPSPMNTAMHGNSVSHAKILFRYPRATAVQNEGRGIQDDSFEKPEYEPEERPEWMWDHDCQEYTYREYALVVKAIRSGQEYIPLNCPP